MVGMYGLIQNIRPFQQRAYRLADHTIINSPAFILGTRIKTIAPPGIFLFLRTKRTERVHISRRQETRHPFPFFRKETAVGRVPDRVMNINRLVTDIIIAAKNQVGTRLLQLHHIFLEIFQPDQYPGEVFEALGYKSYLYSAQKKGYSGVAILTKREPDHVEYGMGMEAYDNEGRFIRADFGDLSVVSVYHPSGTSGDERQAFKMVWLEDFQKYVMEYNTNVLQRLLT